MNEEKAFAIFVAVIVYGLAFTLIGLYGNYNNLFQTGVFVWLVGLTGSLFVILTQEMLVVKK